MPVSPAARKGLADIPGLTVLENVPLSRYTRFGIGGPAAVLCDTNSEESFIRTIQLIREMQCPEMVIGGGTNLVVSDAGFDGTVLRFTGSRLKRDGNLLRIEAGAVLQDVVDQSIQFGLKGLETMTGIPGYLGGAVYGNAGAYGRSIQELLKEVCFFDGNQVRCFQNEDCEFRYRESVFKCRKEWVILSCTLSFEQGDSKQLVKTAAEIRTIRDAKYPPTMKCAGSIFKNLLLAELPPDIAAEIPPNVVREGKVPSAWFLEQTGAKGLRRGDIQVAEYHANLVYNDGAGTGADLFSLIEELKSRVFERFGIRTRRRGSICWLRV